MKRPLAKAGSIINIIISAISLIYYAYASYIMYIVSVLALKLEDEASTTGSELLVYFIIMLSIFALSIAIIVLSSLIIKNCKLSIQDYNKKKKINIALFLITTLVVALHLFYLISVGFGFMSIICIITLVLTNIFLLADLRKNKKALKNPPEEILEQNTTSSQPAPVKPQESIEDRLIKLNDLKIKGLISEEEYNSLKQDLLK